jgi:hypothetical protein
MIRAPVTAAQTNDSVPRIMTCLMMSDSCVTQHVHPGIKLRPGEEFP